MPAAPTTIPTMNQVFWAVVRRLHQLPVFAGVEAAELVSVQRGGSPSERDPRPGFRPAGKVQAWTAGGPDDAADGADPAPGVEAAAASSAAATGCGPAETDPGPTANSIRTRSDTGLAT